jgi:hypothetical protein
MSRTYSIACTQCRKHLWIGQASHAEGMRIYSDVRGKQARFYVEHEGHPLVFGENCEGPIGDFDGVDRKE